MPRGAEYDNGVPQSDNAIEAGQNQVHGTNPENNHLNRLNKVAELPDAATKSGGEHSAQGSAGHPSGKGGHEPKTLGENKGTGAQGV
ncbi:hypothetical protein ASPWEDRAFT_42861 [Aspergillus wentii DTO 134E9]|uniref:Uncharacterized protein n=1 Tax=Aspergillus wentii DTO 134E9 TaxID=1073089 RepID=A0A1L9RD26_ASPWE|nr:uncharacterized protein ASPWEDRAFT_42861 [Aspergillus wentii DTO 134E9]KAI9933104.1 hypothetical protein MW887_007575 [Aspergillus wentii]OJJ32830.1 hypothetical protein ASPWEDRAFT_42861 [Aspergillus wentii DTO 134E9]